MTIASEQAFLPQPQHEQHPPVQHRTTQQAPADDSRPPPSRVPSDDVGVSMVIYVPTVVDKFK